MVQQAILQVIEPLIAPDFLTYSYGFRKERDVHQAINKEKLASWGLKDLNQLYQQRYLSY